MIASEPTVPNLMVLPWTVPLMLRVTGGAESLMLPLTTDPDCCQVSVNVPWKAPLYWPDRLGRVDFEVAETRVGRECYCDPDTDSLVEMATMRFRRRGGGASMTDAATRSERLRALYDLHSEGNAVWGGAYEGDLHGAFARLRDTGPVHSGSVAELVGRPIEGRFERPTYSCFSWETVDAALRDNVTYSSAIHEAQTPFGPNILHMGGEEHRRYRAVSQPAFTRRAAQWWLDRWIVPSVDELLGGIEASGQADLNIEYCALLPLMITTRSFGIPDDDAVGYREMVEGMIRPAHWPRSRRAARPRSARSTGRATTGRLAG